MVASGAGTKVLRPRYGWISLIPLGCGSAHTEVVDNGSALCERDTELAAIQAGVGTACVGGGSLLIVEGPAGPGWQDPAGPRAALGRRGDDVVCPRLHAGPDAGAAVEAHLERADVAGQLDRLAVGGALQPGPVRSPLQM